MARFTLVAIICLAVAAPCARAQEMAQAEKVDIPSAATVLEGIPAVRIDSAEGNTTRHVLNPADADKARLTVRVVDGRFYWTSRGNRPLHLSSTGEFTYLSSEPGKYIRMTRLDDRIFYVEHMDQGLRSITWWGELRIVLRE
jgi:hypothetical protein